MTILQQTKAVNEKEARLVYYDRTHKGPLERWAKTAYQDIKPQFKDPVVDTWRAGAGAAIAVNNVVDATVESAARLVGGDKKPVEGYSDSNPVAYTGRNAGEFFDRLSRFQILPALANVINAPGKLLADGIRNIGLLVGAQRERTMKTLSTSN